MRPAKQTDLTFSVVKMSLFAVEQRIRSISQVFQVIIATGKAVTIMKMKMVGMVDMKTMTKMKWSNGHSSSRYHSMSDETLVFIKNSRKITSSVINHRQSNIRALILCDSNSSRRSVFWGTVLTKGKLTVKCQNRRLSSRTRDPCPGWRDTVFVEWWDMNAQMDRKLMSMTTEEGKNLSDCVCAGYISARTSPTTPPTLTVLILIYKLAGIVSKEP